jgi:hypothetical protein
MSTERRREPTLLALQLLGRVMTIPRRRTML